MGDLQCDINSNRQLKRRQLMDEEDFNGDLCQLEEDIDNDLEGFYDMD